MENAELEQTQALALRDDKIIRADITPAQAKVNAIAALTMSAYEKASTLKLSQEEIDGLRADFPDEAFLPGAAGKEQLLFIEHAHLRDRLNQVFGPGQWSIVPRNRWAEDFSTGKGTEASRVYVEAMLCIRGCFVAEAVGDMVYYKNNDSQNYGDAVEGAKTAALRRCAKELGIGLQAWKKSWCDGWWARQRGGRQTTNVPQKPAQPAQPAQKPSTVTGTAKPPGSEPGANPATEEQRLRWIAELKLRGDWALGYCYDKAWLMPESGPDDDRTPAEPLESLEARHVPTTRKQADAIVAELDSLIPADQRPKPPGASRPPSTSGGQASGASQGNVAPKNTVLRHSEPDQQPWYAAVVPVPYKGIKRDQYLKRPDTIGELYNLRHDDDQARRRLFGFVHNFEPKGWTNREGKPMPPSKADIQFRADLDAFSDWFQENHPEESND